MTDTYNTDTYGDSTSDYDSYHSEDEQNGYSEYQQEPIKTEPSSPEKDWDVMTQTEQIEKLKNVSKTMWHKIAALEQKVETLSKRGGGRESSYRENVDLGISPVPSDWSGRIGNWVKDKETGGLSVCVTEESIYYPDEGFVHNIDGINYVRVVVVSKQGKANWILVDTREDGPGRISSSFEGQYDINKGRQLVIVPRNMWLGVKNEPTMVDLVALEAASQAASPTVIPAEEEPF